MNLDGHRQADLSVHGGLDKAIYAYAMEETRGWGAVGRGASGEYLTTEGIDVSGALLGERWRVGTTLLEAIQPRLPCFKLGLRLEDPGMVKRFAQASCPGVYLRIVEAREFGAGDAIEVDFDSVPGHGVSVRLVSYAILLDTG